MLSLLFCYRGVQDHLQQSKEEILRLRGERKKLMDVGNELRSELFQAQSLHDDVHDDVHDDFVNDNDFINDFNHDQGRDARGGDNNQDVSRYAESYSGKHAVFGRRPIHDSRHSPASRTSSSSLLFHDNERVNERENDRGRDRDGDREAVLQGRDVWTSPERSSQRVKPFVAEFFDTR
jgi:hypothetical protein